MALFLDWVPFIVNSQSPRVRKSWEDAFLKVVEVGVQSGAVDIEVWHPHASLVQCV